MQHDPSSPMKVQQPRSETLDLDFPISSEHNMQCMRKSSIKSLHYTDKSQTKGRAVSFLEPDLHSCEGHGTVNILQYVSK
ncbi:hypothetical protein Bca4012_026647 [Brassica carinata]